MEGFDELPYREKICLSLKSLGKNREDIRTLWEYVLRQVRNDTDRITSTVIKGVWDHLMDQGKVTGVPPIDETESFRDRILAEHFGDTPVGRSNDSGTLTNGSSLQTTTTSLFGDSEASSASPTHPAYNEHMYAISDELLQAAAQLRNEESRVNNPPVPVPPQPVHPVQSLSMPMQQRFRPISTASVTNPPMIEEELTNLIKYAFKRASDAGYRFQVQRGDGAWTDAPTSWRLARNHGENDALPHKIPVNRRSVMPMYPGAPFPPAATAPVPMQHPNMSYHPVSAPTMQATESASPQRSVRPRIEIQSNGAPRVDIPPLSISQANTGAAMLPRLVSEMNPYNLAPIQTTSTLFPDPSLNEKSEQTVLPTPVSAPDQERTAVSTDSHTF